MKIIISGKKEELSYVCKNVDDFIELLDKKIQIKKYLNLNNDKIKNKLLEFFEFYCQKNGVINFSERFKKELDSFFGFQLTGNRCKSYEALKERGFSDTEAKQIISDIHKEYSEKAKKLREELFEKKKEYEFGKIKYVSNDEPVCNLCGSRLKLEWTGHGSKKILGCLNEHCDGFYKKPSSKNKIRALVPDKQYDEYIKRMMDSRILNIQYWINKGYTEEEAKQEISKKQQYNTSFLTPDKRVRINKDFIINKFGIDECDKFFKERSVVCVEYWVKRGFTEEYAFKKIHEIQSKNAKLVKTHGVAKRIDYWINNGYSEEEAKEKLSESQRTFSKEKCIEKYGETEGLKRWEERQNKWQKSLHESENLHVGFSKVSQDLFKIISEKIKNNEYLFFGSKNHEYSIRDNNVNYIYDFTDLENRKIIEFQGDIYHGNPELFTENEHPNPFHKDKSCKDLWEFDAKKANIAKEHGFQILHIWEKEYRQNKDEVINKCLKFLKNE